MNSSEHLLSNELGYTQTGLKTLWKGKQDEIAASLLAHKSLVQHVIAVAKALRLSLTQGRNAISRIVGRRAIDPDCCSGVWSASGTTITLPRRMRRRTLLQIR